MYAYRFTGESPEVFPGIVVVDAETGDIRTAELEPGAVVVLDHEVAHARLELIDAPTDDALVGDVVHEPAVIDDTTEEQL